MNTPAPDPDLDELRRLVARAEADAADAQRTVAQRVAAALTATPPAAAAHAPVQAQMADIAAAELRGDDVVRLYPAFFAHLDRCDACTLEYAQLLEFLLAMDAAAQEPTAAPPPAAVSALAAEFAAEPALQPAADAAASTGRIVFLRRWLERTAHALLAAQQRSTLGLAAALDELLAAASASLLRSPAAQAQQALGMGSMDATVRVIIALEQVAVQVRVDLAAQGTPPLPDPLDADALARVLALAQQRAAQVARQAHLPAAERQPFVTAVLRSIEADPDAFAALVRP